MVNDLTAFKRETDVIIANRFSADLQMWWTRYIHGIYLEEIVSMILVIDGAGFIGANFVLDWLAYSDEPVLNLDKPTCAGNLHNLDSLRPERPPQVEDIASVPAREILQNPPQCLVHVSMQWHPHRP